MAQHRQSGHLYSNGGASDHSHVSIGIRTSNSQLQQKPGRVRKWGRSDKARFASGFSFSSVSVVLCLVLLVTVLTYYYLSIDSKEINEDRVEDDDDARNESDFLTNVSRMDSFKVHGFGKGSVVHGRDSRYWDRDDRRRDEDYDEDDVDHSSEDSKGHSTDEVTGEKKVEIGRRKMYRDALSKGLDRRGVGLYNEDGRKELKKYEAEYEASLKTGVHLGENGVGDQIRNGDDSREQNVIDIDEYDDGIGLLDVHGDEYGNSEHDMGNPRNEDGTESSKFVQGGRKDHKTAKDIKETTKNSIEKRSLSKSQILDNVDTNFRSAGGVSASKSRSDSKKKTKRRKFSGSCEMKFLNITQLVEPLESGKFARFSLQYVDKEENPNNQKQWEPRFAGHQSLQEREDSFLAHDKKIHCGFVKGPEGSPSTGFDLTEDDENYLCSCHIAVISCIFGNSDRLRSPVSKMVSRLSRKNVCFVMFVDELTLRTLSSENQMPDREGFIGLWKIVVVKNLPYADMRRVGKVPKLLPHRLFPSARYSIWLDSKLRFQVDPMLVLEYFLWRKGYEYAISNHYDRHCVWEEVAQNKRLNKYNHTVIDEQFAFYQADGLKRFNASDPKKILPSNVPEGSLIVRAHTPMSNLFSCLWFNEVERFTPRDQLSFTYTYQKLRRMNPGKPFRLNMFKDCERRAIAKLFRHRSEEKRNIIHQESAE